MEKEELEQALAALQAEHEAMKKAHAEELGALKKQSAMDLAIWQAGAHNVRTVKALVREEDVTLGPDGALEGLAGQLRAIRASDPYLFASRAPVQSFVPGESADALPGADGAPERLTYAQLAAQMQSE